MSETDMSTSGDSQFVINIMEDEGQMEAAETMTRLLVGVFTRVRERLRHIGDRQFRGMLISLVESLVGLDRARGIQRRGVSTIPISWLSRCLQTAEIRQQSFENRWQLGIGGIELLALVISNARQALPFISDSDFFVMVSQIGAYAERIIGQRLDRERESRLREASSAPSRPLRSIIIIDAPGDSADRIAIGVQVSEESSSSDFRALKKKAPDSSSSSEDAINTGFRKQNESRSQK